MEGIIIAVITAAGSIAAVVITSAASNRKLQQQLEVSQAVTNTKIENLTQEVRKHNDFSTRIPVLEEQMRVANHRIDDLERDMHEHP